MFSLRQITLVPGRLLEFTVDIASGVTAVLGPSGAGKTSLLNVLAAFEEPASGTIKRPKKIFWAPQDGGLWPGLTVQEHLAAMTRDQSTIQDMLEKFELHEHAQRTPDTMSRGQQARLTVARALLSDAAALIMDEPLAHIDATRRAPFWRVIRDAITARGQSLVFATHEPELALGEAEYALCVQSGKLICSHTVSDLYWKPETPAEAAFLGPANWITPAIEALWFGDNAPAQSLPACLRPEQLAIVPARPADTAIVVRATHFRGSHEEAVLQHVPSNNTETFWHRPSAPILSVGDKVCLRPLLTGNE